MNQNGRQVFLVNEYDPKTTFYRLCNVENYIRSFAEDFKNSYQIVVFACCRENLNRNKHSGGIPKELAESMQKTSDEKEH